MMGFSNTPPSVTVSRLVTLTVGNTIDWLLAVAKENQPPTTLKQLNAHHGILYTGRLENWAMRVYNDALESLAISEWLYTAASELHPATDLAILQIAYHGAHPKKAELEGWAWSEFMVLTDRRRGHIGSARHFTEPPTGNQHGQWAQVIAFK